MLADPILSHDEPGQVAIAMRPGLTCHVGVNPTVAQMIVDRTGDTISTAYRTAGFIDDDGRVLAVALHGLGSNRILELSFVSSGLPLTRDILRALAVTLFDEIGAGIVLTWVRRADLGRRDALERLGFRVSPCRDHDTAGERVLMSATPDDLPARYRRARLRRGH